MRGLAEYAMRGRSQAAIAAIVLALLSLLIPLFSPGSLLSTAIVGLVVLRKGSREGLILALGGCVVLALMGWSAFGRPGITLTYGLMLWLPVTVLALVLRETRNLAVTVEILLLLGAASLTTLYLWHPDLAGFWNEIMQDTMALMLDKSDLVFDETGFQSMLTSLSQVMSGIVVAGSMLSILMGLLLARWWQSILFNPGGFGEEFLALHGRSGSVYATAVFILLGLTASGWLAELGFNLCILSAVLYLLIGTSVLHTILARTQKKMLLWILYLTIFIIPHVLIPLILVGFTDTWINWRSRFIRSSNNK